ncbi:uncharacterized protein LOC128882334 [Hylaeus volcanicus]|uniref:uncharacterized protein LOC128882334 n=1 Tax=Hylaeus volcanicus TaxID=313075 RepID=UPI0023B861BB|nr:uncharacterized protein LOC128882334 [Hylaeus volcanicus]XP_053989895.1 uncharacterized protein LOC128882334 [Hylaeus volcanicus]
MKIVNNIVYGPAARKVPNISVQQYVLDSLRTESDRVMQEDIATGKCLTRRDILESSVALAEALKMYGIGNEDRITIVSENHPNFVIAMCSIFYVGGVHAPLNPLYTEREYAHMLNILQPRVIFVSEKCEVLIGKIVSTLSWKVSLIQLDDRALTENVATLKELVERHKGRVDPYTFVPAPVNDTSKAMAAIFGSSGTTGFPKGVALSHRNLLTFVHNVREPNYLDIQGGDRVLIFLPLFHGYAFGMVLASLYSGAITVIMRSFKIEPFLRTIEDYKITHLPLVPPILVLLAKHPTVPNYDFSSVRVTICGAAPYPKDVGDAMKRRTKIQHIQNGYGMTELSIITHLGDKTRPDGNLATFFPGLLCKVVDPETNETLRIGETGEVCVAGDHVMLGYFKNPSVTDQTIDKEKWLHTGDLGYFNPDGTLEIAGRLKELIKYKGYQVAPSEIEDVIQSYPGVKDAAVIGKPDEESGEVPMAFVVRLPNGKLTAQEILDYTNKHLSPQKRLRGGITFVEEIPKTPSGKILRRELLKLISKL